ncbi:MAG: hypothetical protein ABI355_09270 [Solirubrobacteraceae bacterium]
MIAVAGDTEARSAAVLADLKFSWCDLGCEDLDGAMAPRAEKP